RLDRQSSDVAVWSRQTCDHAAADRVYPQRKDDGNDLCHLLYCEDGECICNNDVDLEADKLGGDLDEAAEPGWPVFDPLHLQKLLDFGALQRPRPLENRCVRPCSCSGTRQSLP